MPRMTTEEIKAIRERSNRATPPPWEQPNYNTVFDKDKLICRQDDADTDEEEIRYQYDFDFIANARTDIPALLADRESLELECSVWRRLYRIECESLSDTWQMQARVYKAARSGDFPTASKLLDEAGYAEGGR